MWLWSDENGPRFYHQFILSKEIAECRLRQIREMDAKIFK